MKKNTRYYTTVYSLEHGFILKPSGTPPNMVELYCLAYNAETKKRLPVMDGYYYRHDLRIVRPSTPIN